MILFINPISEKITLTLLDNGELRHTSTLEKGSDFDTFPDEVVKLVEKHDIKEIWCITGPGAFTRMRIVILTLNTLHLSKHITLKGCHFFELIRGGDPILRANDREYIVLSEDGIPHLKNKEDIPPGSYIGYGEKNDFTNGADFIEYSEDYSYIHEYFSGIPISDHLSPIYLKDPNITWSKKSTSPSSKTMNKS